jgi:hypothetical protein
VYHYLHNRHVCIHNLKKAQVYNGQTLRIGGGGGGGGGGAVDGTL